MKTRKQIWMEVQGEVDKWSFNGEIEPNQRWYSEEELREILNSIYVANMEIDDVKKLLFGDEE